MKEIKREDLDGVLLNLDILADVLEVAECAAEDAYRKTQSCEVKKLVSLLFVVNDALTATTCSIKECL